MGGRGYSGGGLGWGLTLGGGQIRIRHNDSFGGFKISEDIVAKGAKGVPLGAEELEEVYGLVVGKGGLREVVKEVEE